MSRTLPVLLAVLVALAPLQGCLSGDVPFVGGEDNTTEDGGTDDGTDTGADGGGDDGNDEPPPLPQPTFNGSKAYRWVERQVTWPNGTTHPRVPGTPGAKEAREIIAKGLGKFQWNVNFQRWKGHYVCEETKLRNVVATLPGRTNQQIILGAHYDTRPWSERAADYENMSKAGIGANDGGSGVAGLLELARVLRENRPLNHTIKLVFFDAEDGGNPPRLFSDCNPDEHPGHHTPGGWIIGSSHYVAQMSDQQRNRTEAVIVLDMIGDENLTLLRDRSSYKNERQRGLQDRVWKIADGLGYSQFRNNVSTRVLDDHRPFQRVGIKAVDLIHLDRNGSTPFPATWHAHNDTLEHISPDSLEAVGRVAERTVYALDRDLGRP